MKTYLGIDGGGTKTAFLIIDESGQVLATHREGAAYYFESSWDEVRSLFARGIRVALGSAGLPPSDLTFAFLGIPAYGEDSRLLAQLDDAPSPTLEPGRYRCGNDAVCGWAGALACQDGINVVAGTGSIAYGEFRGRSARAGGWGELFGDEGSAHWIALEGLRLFSRMSDGRAPRGALYEAVRRHFNLQSDLDLCAAIYGNQGVGRSQLASWATLVGQAAESGDAQAAALFERAAEELAQIVQAVHQQLHIPQGETVLVSYTGGLFQERRLLTHLTAKLATAAGKFSLALPRLSPVAGAALYAAKLAGTPLSEAAVRKLEAQLQSRKLTTRSEASPGELQSHR